MKAKDQARKDIKRTLVGGNSASFLSDYFQVPDINRMYVSKFNQEIHALLVQSSN